MSDIISLGLWIKRRRKALDLTQDALAALVGCSKDLIAKIEGDARRPSRAIAALLATHLQLAVDERAPFIQAARAELGVDRLAPPTQSVARGAFVPAQVSADVELFHTMAAGWWTTLLRLMTTLNRGMRSLRRSSGPPSPTGRRISRRSRWSTNGPGTMISTRWTIT